MSDTIQIDRFELQNNLDKLKSEKDRNILGQYSTPTPLSDLILTKAKEYFAEDTPISFLDPAIGTGVFYGSLVSKFNSLNIVKASGFEIDKHYGNPSKEFWKKSDLNYYIEDFTEAIVPTSENGKYNLIICNPPYVRHHHLNGKKDSLKQKSQETIGIKMSALSGLYCYFIALTHNWMAKDGLSIWLIPSEFMDVNYGKAIKKYLTDNVTLIQIHRFDPNDQQFSDALVTSCVVIFKNTKPSKKSKIQFSYGTDLLKPNITKQVSLEVLKKEEKWSRFPLNDIRENVDLPKLKDYFVIKRGIATGDNSFFILDEKEAEKKKIPFEFLKPILPSPRFVKETIIDSDNEGYPLIDKRQFVLDCRLPIEDIEINHPALFKYLQEGVSKGVTERYICKNRKLWYGQENRKPSPFLFTYIGRSTNTGNSFRFLLNNSEAIVTNSFLMVYPKDIVQAILNDSSNNKLEILEILNRITNNSFLKEGRVYGGGMRKFEPKELSNVAALELEEYIKKAHNNVYSA